MTDQQPQTAFLQDAAALALRNIVARLDRERAFQPYFKVVLEPPARAVHDSWDYCDMTGRYVEAFCLLRSITGQSAEEEEAGLRRFLLRMQNPDDGLFYNQDGENSQYVADMFCQSRVLLGLCTWFMESGDTTVLDSLRRHVHGLARIVERRDDYAFYPRNLYREGEWLEGGLFYEPKDLWTVKPGYGGTQLEGVMKYAELTGDETAVEFTRQYLRYFLETTQTVDEEGRFAGHLHSQGVVPTMVGAAMFAEMTNDRELLARCERFLRFVLANSSAFGWIPDGILAKDGSKVWPTCETCALGDVIHLAARLSRLGQGDFWYDIERIARNQLLENQFRDPAPVLEGRQPHAGLAEIVRGSFASWAHPNDLLGGPDIEGCCTGGGVRALYHVLNNCVGIETDGTRAVRMLFSVETDDLRIQSGLPYAGRITAQMKVAARLKLRRPEGVEPSQLTVRVNGQNANTQLESAYLLLEPLSIGDIIEMEFPLALSSRQERVAGQTYTADWKGNSIVRLEPEGTTYPTYRRAAWLTPAAPKTPFPYPPLRREIHW